MERDLHEADLKGLLAEVERRLSQYSASGPHRRVHGAEDHVGVVGGGGGHTIQEDGVNFTARTNLNFLEPDAALVADDAINNATKVNMALYALLAGRAGGQTLIGGNAINNSLTLKANSVGGTSKIIIDASNLQLASGASYGILDSGGTRRIWLNTTSPQVVIDGDTAFITGLLQDSAANTRVTLATATPHVTLTGDVRITGSGSASTSGALQFNSTTAPFYGITMTQSISGATYNGINISPTLTSTANGTVINGILGLAQMLVNAHTGNTLAGLDFQARAAPASGTTLGTVTSLYAIKATADARIAAGVTSTLGVTAMTCLWAQISWNISTILGAGATDTLNITTARGLNIAAPAIVTGGSGTEVVATTTLLGIDVDAIAVSNASVTITNAIQLRVGDLTGTSFTAANNRVVQFGSATPTTTSGLFEMMANFTAAANATPIWISEGATPTRRQLKTFDPGNAGVNFTAGQLVCVLV